MALNKKIPLLALALLFTAGVFAKTYITDYKGREVGSYYPDWISLLEKAAGTNKSGADASGKFNYSSKTKKLFKKLDVGKNAVLYYSIQTNPDIDIASVAAEQAARAIISEGNSVIEIFNIVKIADFWQKEYTKNGEVESQVYRVFVVFCQE